MVGTCSRQLNSENLFLIDISDGNVFLTVITSGNLFPTVITSGNVFSGTCSGKPVPDFYNKWERVLESYKWRERFAHAIEQIVCAQAARRPSKLARRTSKNKGNRCFLGRRKAKWLYLKTTMIVR